MSPDDSPRAIKGDLKYNTSLINALAFYIGVTDMAKHGPAAASKANSPAQKLLTHIVAELTAEGRYMLLSALGNQLRFPSSHTHYFSCMLLHIFCEVTVDAVMIRVRLAGSWTAFSNDLTSACVQRPARPFELSQLSRNQDGWAWCTRVWARCDGWSWRSTLSIQSS